MKKPDEQVEDNILAEFRKIQLLSEHGLTKLKGKISAGNLTAEDWIVIIETDRPQKEGANENKG